MIKRTSKKVIILGGMGNGTVVAAAIDDANLRGFNEWVMTGYLNDRLTVGDDLEGHPVLGSLSDTSKFLNEGYYFINTIYRIDGQDKRIALFENLNLPEEQLATFIHPRSYIAGSTEIGPGCVVMPNVSISPGTRLGCCCLIMVNANVGHNIWIGNHCHFAAQSCLGAYLEVEDGVHIGLNASVRENLKLGKCSALGMGGVLLDDMKPFEIWGGVPARFIRMAKKELKNA